ncbi:MAG: hypothetical protein QW658_02420, partial [Candidatus Bathyarchaeia archaeon]
MKKVLSTILLATLVLSVVAIAGVVPVKAAVVGTLEVSSPQFFGDAVVQVKLYDPDLSGLDMQQITYSISGGPDKVMNLISPLKNGEFFGYFANQSAIWANSSGDLQNPPYNNNSISITKDTLSKGDTITFKYMDSSPVGTVTTTVTYDQYVASATDLTFDRASLEYPMNGWIRIYVKDYDYNRDPTGADNATMTINFYSINGTLLDSKSKTATETGPASGVFKLDISYYSNQSLFTGDLNLTGTTSGTPIKVAYGNESPEPFKYITLKSFPVSLVVDPTFTTRGGLTITLQDPNLNLMTWKQESINGTIYNTYVNVTLGADVVQLNLMETGTDTGVFTATVPVSIGAPQSDGILQYNLSATKASIQYYFNGTLKAQTISTLSTTPASITSDKTQYRATGTVKLTITAPDLNDDPANINFFTCNILGGNATISSIDVYQNSQPVGKLTIKVNGLLATGAQSQNLVFIETGEDTGIFTASLDLSKIYNYVNGSLANGDSVTVSYADQINSVTSSVTFTIGVAAASISLDRATYPVPKDGDVKIYLSVTDSEANTDPSTIQTRDAYVDVYYYNGTLQNSTLVPITETGPNTGVFTGTYTLPQSNDPALINGWVKALYVDPASGENITATATLVATDAAISVDMATVKAGDKFTITVTDPDNNLDSKSTQSVIVYYEYTDNTGTKQTGNWSLTETDVNTGKFTISKTVGSDIKVQPGSTMTFTYKDNSPSYITASAGYPSSPVEYTATVKVASFTGTLSIDKSEYGLGSQMVITVDDPDLNTDITTAESTQVTLRISGYPDQTLPLNEDGASSSVFSTTYPWNSTDTNLIGKVFQIYYKDSVDANGNTVYAVVTGTVKSWDAEVSFDKAYYNVGD